MLVATLNPERHVKPQGGTQISPESETFAVPIPHEPFLDKWIASMENGTLTGRAYSPRTVDDYKRYTTEYLSKHKSVSFQGLEEELSGIDVAKFATREHYYKAVLCLGRYLIREGVLDESFLVTVKPLYPKRHKPPKRLVVNEVGVKDLLSACRTHQERLIVTLLGRTGLRVTEACDLNWGDIDTDTGRLVVRCGKGGKARQVGMPSQLIQAFVGHKAHYRKASGRRNDNSKPTSKSPVFLNRISKRMGISGLFQRLQRLGERAGVQVNPHSLRRAFVTINAGKGRSLAHLQKACGHTSVTTTMSYCLLTENEVIDAMKDW